MVEEHLPSPPANHGLRGGKIEDVPWQPPAQQEGSELVDVLVAAAAAASAYGSLVHSQFHFWSCSQPRGRKIFTKRWHEPSAAQWTKASTEWNYLRIPVDTLHPKINQHTDTFRLDLRKKFFPVRVVRPRHRLPREAVAAPSLGGFKASWWSSEQPDLVEDVPAHGRGLE